MVSAEPSRSPEAPSPPAPHHHPRPQKALSPVRTQCPSRSPAPARRPGASPQECGLGPGSGRQDSQGGNTMGSPDPGRGAPRPPPRHRPQLLWLETQQPPHSLAARGVRAQRLRRWEGSMDPKFRGAEGPGGGEGAQGLRRPLYKQPAQPRHTPGPPHISPPPLFQTLAPKSPARVA